MMLLISPIRTQVKNFPINFFFNIKHRLSTEPDFKLWYSSIELFIRHAIRKLESEKDEVRGGQDQWAASLEIGITLSLYTIL